MQNSIHVARFILKDQHLYGSSRLGLKKRNQMVYGKKFTGSYNSGLLDYTVSGATYAYEPVVEETSYRRQRGLKRYEFANHLGNVLAVTSDRLLSVPVVSTTTHDHYTADVLQAQDYYPFGMTMPRRSYQVSANERAYSPVTVLASAAIETFKDDDEGWEASGGTANHDAGSERLEVTSSTAWHGTRKDYTTVAGEQYRFKFDLDMGDFLNIHIEIMNKVGGATTTLVYDLVKSTGTREYTFTATGTTTRLFIRRGGNGVNKTFYLDNVEFSKLSAADAGQLMAVSEGYRYGFNGMERDDEWNGTGNAYDFGARIYDSRIGKFLSLDPKMKDYPFMSPFCYAANNPIRYVDVNGEGPEDFAKGFAAAMADYASFGFTDFRNWTDVSKEGAESYNRGLQVADAYMIAMSLIEMGGGATLIASGEITVVAGVATLVVPGAGEVSFVVLEVAGGIELAVGAALGVHGAYMFEMATENKETRAGYRTITAPTDTKKEAIVESKQKTINWETDLPRTLEGLNKLRDEIKDRQTANDGKVSKEDVALKQRIKRQEKNIGERNLQKRKK